jgi:multisubunit Na+/H+ antiporter MnhB subunit
MTLRSVLSVGVGVVLTVALIALLFALDVRRMERRRGSPQLRLATAALVGAFLLIIVARFVEFA